MTTNEEQLLTALNKGPVQAIGDTVFDVELRPLFNKTEMYHAVRALGNIGVRIHRVDGGGTPTWRVLSADEASVEGG